MQKIQKMRKTQVEGDGRDRNMIIIYLIPMVAITLLIGIGLSKFIELKPGNQKKNNLDKLPPEGSEGGHY